jgi:hypothetical protein
MLRDIRRRRGLLAAVALLSLVASACSSSAATAAPSGTPPAPSGNSGSPTAGGSGLSGAAASLSVVSSYKFTMTLAGGSFGSLFSLLPGGGPTGNAAFTVSGTIVTSPAQAADITMGSFHIIEIGGYDYMDLGAGGFVKTPVTDTGLADSLSPATLFSSAITGSTAGGYQLVGSESKNGVDADHYQASSAALMEYAAILGVSNVTMAGDVWLAKAGGYPVSMAILAQSGSTVAYQLSFDLTNVNDPSNSVTAPSNITGA